MFCFCDLKNNDSSYQGIALPSQGKNDSTVSSTLISNTHSKDTSCGQVTNVYVQGGGKGERGERGPPGNDGQDGQDGAQGERGPPGMDIKGCP